MGVMEEGYWEAKDVALMDALWDWRRITPVPDFRYVGPTLWDMICEIERSYADTLKGPMT